MKGIRWCAWGVLCLWMVACDGGGGSNPDVGSVQDIPGTDGVLDPGTVDPGTVDPGTVDPGTVDPGSTDPGTVDQGTSDPGTVDLGTDPGKPDVGPSDPGEPDPGPGDPGVMDAGEDPGVPDQGQDDPGSDTGADPGPLTPEQTFPTSLHATVDGMRTVYEQGYLGMTEVPYDTPNLGCKDCHAPAIQSLPRRCESCHLDPNQPMAESTCLGCHSRQKTLEYTLAYPDVHRDAGMKCWDCHSSKEMHGDGNVYASMWDEGAMETRCETCHDAPATDPHQVHGEKLDCSACHVKSVASCFSCHFDTQVEQGRKIHAGALHGWVFLVNRNGKVRSGSFQSLTYQGGNRYVRWAPFHGHTIVREGRTCRECHDNAAVQEYKANGEITLTWWDSNAPEPLQNVQGVIPVIAGKMKFQFMVPNETSTWVPMPEGVVFPDQETFWSCSGLTPSQMTMLGIPVTP